MRAARVLRTSTLTVSFMVVVLATGVRASVAQSPTVGPEFRVNTVTAGDQSHPRVAVDAVGNFLVVWGGAGVAAQRFSRSGVRLGGEVSIQPLGSGPDPANLKVDVGMNRFGDFVAGWSDYEGFGPLMVRPFAGTGVARGPAIELNANAYYGLSVEMAADGSFVVAHADYYNWDYSKFAVQSFHRDGRSKGVLYRDNGGFGPAMAMRDDGAFILVWADGGVVLGQRYDGAGNAAGPALQVDGTQPDFAGMPAVALAGDGSFVVAWQEALQNGAQRDVFVRRFNGAGAALGDEVQANVQAGSSYSPTPDVAVAPDGSSLVVWTSREQDGDLGGIFARRFDRHGRALGTEFQVNDFTMFDQHSPAVAIDGGGDAIVVWASSEQDGSGYGVFARRFPAGGSDRDGDGVDDFLDNCPTVANPNQADAGSDHLGDACVAPDVVIHPSAQLGVNPIIRRGTVLGPGVVIGDDAAIGADVRIERRARAGNRVALGDRVTVGIRAALGNEVEVGADTRIEQGAAIGDAVSIGDGVAIGRNVVVGARATIGPLVVLEIGSRIGRGATVEMGARVGARAVVRPGAVVPAGTTVPGGTTFP